MAYISTFRVDKQTDRQTNGPKWNTLSFGEGNYTVSYYLLCHVIHVQALSFGTVHKICDAIRDVGEGECVFPGRSQVSEGGGGCPNVIV